MDDLTLITRWLGRGFGRQLARSSGAEQIVALPDRVMMAQVLIPALAEEAGRILVIGCRGYNRDDYPPLLDAGAEVWTTDIDPGAERWGVSGHHRTGDACRVDQIFNDLTFDAILCNGVLGHGVDRTDQQTQILAAMAKILRPAGRLLLGWNTDRIADPVLTGLTGTWFSPVPFAGLPSRVTFDAVTHVYDSLVRLE